MPIQTLEQLGPDLYIKTLYEISEVGGRKFHLNDMRLVYDRCRFENLISNITHGDRILGCTDGITRM